MIDDDFPGVEAFGHAVNDRVWVLFRLAILVFFCIPRCVFFYVDRQT